MLEGSEQSHVGRLSHESPQNLKDPSLQILIQTEQKGSSKGIIMTTKKRMSDPPRISGIPFWSNKLALHVKTSAKRKNKNRNVC